MTEPVQPYGPGACCGHCGHFAARHDEQGCHFDRTDRLACDCSVMEWDGVEWPRPWLPATNGGLVSGCDVNGCPTLPHHGVDCPGDACRYAELETA